MALDSEPAGISIGPGKYGGTDGLPRLDCYFRYCLGSNRQCSRTVGLVPSPGGVDAPTFWVNPRATVAVEQSWGALKALYR